MKIDAAFIQDVMHHALAMQGDGSSAFRCESLWDRLSNAKDLARMIDRLPLIPNPLPWDEVRPRWESITTSEKLCEIGAAAQKLAENTAREMGINPRTGERA